MRGDSEEDLALSHVLAHQGEIEELQVPEAAVNEARGAGGRPSSEILAFDQADAQTPQRGISRDPTANNSTADNQDVQDA